MAWSGGGSDFNLPQVVAGGFSIGTPPTPSTPTKPLIDLNLASVFSGKDRSRPWIKAVLDGYIFFANDFDQPWWWDGSSASTFNMGSVTPAGSDFTPTENAGGSTFPQNQTNTYYFAYRNSTIGKETAPLIETVTIAAATADVDIAWNGSPSDGQWDEVAIYRLLQGAEGVVLVTTEAIGSSPYTDNTLDAGLAVSDATRYKTRFRTSLPPIFTGIGAYAGRLWGWIKGSSIVRYSQAVRADSEFLADDFPDENIINIGGEDGMGDVVAGLELYGGLYFFKRKGVYAVEGEPGSDAGDIGTLVSRRLFGDRGCVAPRTIIPVENVVMFLDEQGLYLMGASGEPLIAGASGEQRDSPLAPIWDRLNLDAAHYFWAQHQEDEGEYHLYVALDHSPVPLTRIVFDYRENRFVSVDGNIPGISGGWLEDASKTEHYCRVDDLGIVWEDESGNAEGATNGNLTGTVTTAAYGLLTCSAAAFGTTDLTSALGTPIDVWDSAGALVTANRVSAVAATTMELLYFDASTASDADSLEVGVIPYLLQTGKFDFGTERSKLVGKLFLQYETAAGSIIRVDKAHDGVAFVRVERGGSGDLTLAAPGRLEVPIHLRGQRHHWRITTRHPGQDFSLLYVAAHVRSLDLET